MSTKHLIYISSLIILTALSFSSALDNEFVNWDDHKIILGKESVRDFDVGALFSEDVNLHYKPITLLSFAMEQALFGRGPLIVHLNNLLLHLCNVLLVFFLLYRLSSSFYASLLLAAFWALSPMRVESVAWAVERKDVLYSFFGLLSVHSFLSLLKQQKLYLLLLSLTCFVLSVLSKSMGIIIPFVLLFAALLYGNKAYKKPNLTYAISFFILMLMPLIYIISKTNILARIMDLFGGGNESFSAAEIWALSASQFGWYVYKFIWPFNLSAVYPYPESPLSVFYYAMILLPLVFLLLLFFLYRKDADANKHIIWGGLWFVLCWAIVSHALFPLEHALYVDRFTYFGHIGILLMLLPFLSTIANKKLLLMLPIIGLFAVSTYLRADVWQNSGSLWTDVLNKYPESEVALFNKARYLQKQQKAKAAFSLYSKLIKLDPTQAKAYNNRALLQKQNAKAIKDLEMAIQLDPEYSPAYVNYISLLISMNQISKAEEYCRSALQKWPKDKQLLGLLSKIEATQGKLDYRSASDGAGVRELLLLAESAFKAKDNDKAIELLNNLFIQDAQNAKAMNLLGVIYLEQSKPEQAMKAYQQAMQWDISFVDPVFNAGNLEMQRGDLNKAMTYFQMAVDIEPKHASSYANMAYIYHQQGNIDKAMALYNKALELEENPSFYFNRAGVYQSLQNWKLMLQDLEKAKVLGYPIEDAVILEVRKRANNG